MLRNVNIPYLKWASATGLAVLGDRSAIPDILAWIGDPNQTTRDSTIRALGIFRDPSTITPLLDRFKVEKNDRVRATIITTLGRIARPGGRVSVLGEISRDLNWIAAIKMPSLALLARLK